MPNPETFDGINPRGTETLIPCKDATARSGVEAINSKIPSAASSSNKLVDTTAMNDAIGQAVAATYKAAGNKTVAELTNSLLVAANLGKVYNMTDAGTTTADFVEGAGHPIRVGDDIGICEPTSGTFKFNLLSGFIAVDTNPTADSANPVSSGGVKTALDGKVDKVNGKGLSTNDFTDAYKAKVDGAFPRSEQAILGAKNLLNYNQASKTVQGVTFTVNADKSVTINGTNTSNQYYADFMLNAHIKLPTASLFLTGCDDGDGTAYFMNMGENPWTGGTHQYGGNPLAINANSNKEYQVLISVAPGATVNNKTIYPMISYEGSGYVSPAKTNKQLTDEIFTRTEQNIVGSKNIIAPLVDRTAGELTITVNDNDTVTISSSGAITSEKRLYFWHESSTTGQVHHKLPNGTFKLSGASASMPNNVRIELAFWQGSTYKRNVNSNNSNLEAEFTIDDTIADQWDTSCYILIPNGTDLSTPITFKPMISCDGGDYVAPAMTNRALTEQREYKVGDSIGINNSIWIGHITGGSKEIHCFIPLNKPINKGVTGISFSGTVVNIRSNGDYLISNGNLSDYTISNVTVNDLGIFFWITKSDSTTFATFNNMPVSVQVISAGILTLS